MSSDELLKAMEAGLMTGMQYDNQLNNGGGLKPESLDYVLKNLETVWISWYSGMNLIVRKLRTLFTSITNYTNTVRR